MGTQAIQRAGPSVEICYSGQCRCPCHALAREERAISGALRADLTLFTTKERQVFDLLFDELGDWVETNYLARAIWGFADEAEKNTLRNHIVQLRRKLAAERLRWRIETLPHGGGYRLVMISDDLAETA